MRCVVFVSFFFFFVLNHCGVFGRGTSFRDTGVAVGGRSFRGRTLPSVFCTPGIYIMIMIILIIYIHITMLRARVPAAASFRRRRGNRTTREARRRRIRSNVTSIEVNNNLLCTRALGFGIAGAGVDARWIDACRMNPSLLLSRFDVPRPRKNEKIRTM